MIKFFLFALFIVFSSLFQVKQEAPIPVYILIGKNSEHIKYTKTFNIDNDITYKFVFRDTLDFEYTFIRTIIRKKGYLNDTLIKPRSFLDSISYYDEKWLLSAPNVDSVYRLVDHRVYLIDTTGIECDSIIIRPFSFVGESSDDDVIMEGELKFN